MARGDGIDRINARNGKPVKYDDSREHRNVVIADTLDVIENVILFSISNYFLRFSNEYKRFHKVESFKNDWYEYVEYGTTNPLTILLQRSGFSRETSTYMRSLIRGSPAHRALISAKDSAVSSTSSQERTGLLLVIICEMNFCLFSTVCQR